VNGTSQSNLPILNISNSAGGVNNQVGIQLVPYSGRSGGPSSAIYAIDDGNGSAHMTFSTAASGATTTASERMRITDAGNVGTGTTAPTNTLPCRPVFRR